MIGDPLKSNRADVRAKGPELDPLIVRQASCHAALLIRTGCFTRDDFEDLRQDLALDCFRRVPKFNPRRGDWQGFVRVVVRNHASVLITRRSRRAPEILSDDLINRELTSDTDSLDILDKRPNTGEEDAMHLRLDVRRAVKSLPPRLRFIALLLAQLSVKEVCQRTGRSRSGVFLMTRQIREVFIAAGLAPHRRPRSGSSSRTNIPDSRNAKGRIHEDHK